jgi:hypothetical protein
MKFLLTSSGISNDSIRSALVDLLGKPIAQSSALVIPTAIYPFQRGEQMAKTTSHIMETADHVPLSNLNYDLVTALQSKLEAVAAYEVYLKDCEQSGDKECQELVAELKRDDERHIERLRGELERIVRAGKFHE